MNHASKIRPARLTLHDTALACQVVRGIGFGWVCACGEQSERIYRTHEAARRAAREHRLAELGLD